MGHDVAPVAGGIADGEQDRLVFPPGLSQGFFPPRIPVHGIMGMLQEIRAGLVDEVIHTGLPLRNANRCDSSAITAIARTAEQAGSFIAGIPAKDNPGR